MRQWLREQIDSCEGLIQIVGQGYGAEPPDVDADYGRVSYTQFEFLYARLQDKKTWVINAGEQCQRDTPLEQLDLPRDPTRPDLAGYQAERRQLQQDYIARLRTENHSTEEKPALPKREVYAADAPPTTRKPKTSGLAIASLVCGLVPLFWLFGVPAITFGHMARKKIKRSNGELQGAKRALAGLVLGYLLLAISISGLVREIRSSLRESAMNKRSNGNLRQLVQAGVAHGKVHDGRLPSSREELRSSFSTASMDQFMDLPYTEQNEKDGYGIVPGIDTWMFHDTIYAFETVRRPNGTIGVAFLDGTVGTFPVNALKVQELKRYK